MVHLNVSSANNIKQLYRMIGVLLLDSIDSISTTVGKTLMGSFRSKSSGRCSTQPGPAHVFQRAQFRMENSMVEGFSRCIITHATHASQDAALYPVSTSTHQTTHSIAVWLSCWAAVNDKAKSHTCPVRAYSSTHQPNSPETDNGK